MERKLWPCGVVLVLQLLSCAAVETFKFEVLEEQKTGTFVADMSNNSIAGAFKALPGDEDLRFHFQGTVPVGSFTINSTTGVIRTAGKLDREDLSLYEDTFQIQVKISKGRINAVIPTVIKVLDINDNSPTFAETTEYISVSESAPLGAELPITVANDNDIGKNGVQTYTIVSRNDGGSFGLKISRPTAQLTKLKLVVLQRLDREKNNSYYLVIEASDGGNPPKVGRKALNITILDSNDHIPKFSQDLYVGEVRENAQAGTYILQVNATDNDIGTNAEIVYMLKPSPRYDNLFNLDETTGELQTKAVLDFEKAKSYQLEITAQDKGPDSIRASAVINVKVLDENDNSPEITVTTLSDAFDQQGRLPEDTPVNTNVAIVAVSDKDSGSNGRVTVTLRRHKQDFALQEMFTGQYILKVQRPLSLDRHAQYDIKIVAADQGSPTSQQTSEVFKVTLADSNRHAPEFAHRVVNLKVSDDVKVGALITVVTAVDKDDGRNAELTYSLESIRIGQRNGSDEDKSKWLSIDSSTGELRLRSKLWCVFTPSFALNIEATDNGRQPLRAKTTLDLSIQCVPHVNNFTVAENSPAGTEVGRIEFSDISPHRPLQLRLMSSAFSPEFVLDNKTGILTTKRRLDREVIASYALNAILSDGSVDDKIQVNVLVADVNDNAPIFVGLQEQRNITITDDLSEGTKVLQIRAVDKDSGSNGVVKYAIIRGNEKQVFHITNSGRITLRKKPTNVSYHLLIRASDSGYVEKESFLRVGITVKFINPLPPVTASPGKSPETKPNDGVAGVNTKEGGFFSDTKMIIVVAACAAFLLLTIVLIVVFCLRCKRKQKRNQEVDKRSSYHEPDITREHALLASQKMFHEATSKQRKSPEVVHHNGRQKPINISPIPLKKMHPMTYPFLGARSPDGTVQPDMYYPVDDVEEPEAFSSDEDPDSGRGGSSHGSSPYHVYNVPVKDEWQREEIENEWQPLHPTRHMTTAPAHYRVRSPGMPPPPPPYEEVPGRGAFVQMQDFNMLAATDL